MCSIYGSDVDEPRLWSVETTDLVQGVDDPISLGLVKSRQGDVGPAFSSKRPNGDDVSSPSRRPGGDSIPWLHNYWSPVVEDASEFSAVNWEHRPGVLSL